MNPWYPAADLPDDARVYALPAATPGNIRPSGGKYQKGQSGNPSGRPKGLLTQKTLEIKALAAELLSDALYLQQLRIRLRVGDAPHMEKFFAEHLWGKPKEQIEHSGQLALVHVLIERISTAKERARAKKEDANFYPRAINGRSA